MQILGRSPFSDASSVRMICLIPSQSTRRVRGLWHICNRGKRDGDRKVKCRSCATSAMFYFIAIPLKWGCFLPLHLSNAHTQVTDRRHAKELRRSTSIGWCAQMHGPSSKSPLSPARLLHLSPRPPSPTQGGYVEPHV